MKSYYWDTSAAINAVLCMEVWNRLNTDRHYTRVHLYSEFFAVMTGRGVMLKDEQGESVRFRLSAKDAAVWLRKFDSRVQSVDLDTTETLDALEQAQRKGIQGGRVYDYVHALAAEKANVDIVLTRNSKDFTGLSSKPVEWP